MGCSNGYGNKRDCSSFLGYCLYKTGAISRMYIPSQDLYGVPFLSSSCVVFATGAPRHIIELVAVVATLGVWAMPRLVAKRLMLDRDMLMWMYNPPNGTQYLKKEYDTLSLRTISKYKFFTIAVCGNYCLACEGVYLSLAIINNFEISSVSYRTSRTITNLFLLTNMQLILVLPKILLSSTVS